MGHKVESCLYTTRASKRDGEDRTKNADPAVLDRSTPSEETYRPWVIVS